MMWLDFAIASRKDAERAFFDFDDADAVDEITRLQLANLSDCELAHLGMLLCDGYNPQLVLDGDAPDEVITACDPQLVRALAALTEAAAVDELARRWHAQCDVEDASETLHALQRMAVKAATRNLPLLYAQGDDRENCRDD